MAVIGSDQNERILQAMNSFEMSNSSLNGIIQLEQLPKSTFIIKHVHHLIDGSSFRHDEPTLLSGASIEDIDGLDCHLEETWLVDGIGLQAVGGVVLVLEVRCVDIAVEPFGHVGDGEDTEGFAVVAQCGKRCCVLGYAVAFVCELGVHVTAQVGLAALVEVLRSTTEENIRTLIGSN